MQQLQRTLHAKRAVCCIHTLGFSADHDVRFLSSLTRAGSVEGTFHYLRSSADVAPTMEIVTALMLASSFAPALELFNGDGLLVSKMLLRKQADTETHAPHTAAGAEVQTLTGFGHVDSLPAETVSLRAKVRPALISPRAHISCGLHVGSCCQAALGSCLQSNTLLLCAQCQMTKLLSLVHVIRLETRSSRLL